ncbi:MAG: dTMP kinase [Candidatus Altiarchaeota archaeon]|nr:dTMP kinase [Candidatus Altiarchaeota archaeon]
MFIVLEGIDGCGKSTQAQLLHDWLVEEGRDVLLTAEPTNNVIGSYVKEILSSGREVDPSALALLFTADRHEHIKGEIEPALKARKTVISERYYHSTVAYQAAQGVDRSWLIDINSFPIENKPDVTFFLDIKAEVALPKIQEKDQRFRELLENSRKKVEDLRKHYLNNKKAIYTKINQKKAADELLEVSRRLEMAEEEYKREKSKYLRFERFEKPTTLEAETQRYDVFLGKVRENYLQFKDVVRIDGSKPVDLVFEDIKRSVRKIL